MRKLTIKKPPSVCVPREQDELWPSLEIAFWHVYVMCKRSLLATASPPFSSPLFTHPSLAPRLEECSSEVPLLPREVLVSLSTQLWHSVLHLSSATEQNSSAPHPLLLIKFFVIVCRWGAGEPVNMLHRRNNKKFLVIVKTLFIQLLMYQEKCKKEWWRHREVEEYRCFSFCKSAATQCQNLSLTFCKCTVFVIKTKMANLGKHQMD